MKARRVVREATRVLDLKDGDVLVFDKSKAPLRYADIEAISKHLGMTGRERCLVVIVQDMDGVHLLDEEQMRERGWVRLEEEEE